MISIKENLAKQLDGPRINTVVNGITYCFNKFMPYLSYLTNISIPTAQEVDLETLGYIVGYIRPLVPNEVILEKLFRFSNYLVAPSFSEVGFSSLLGTVDGGNFSQLGLVLDSNKLPLAQYRSLLKAVARLRWNKNSLYSIDLVCNTLHSTYEITFLDSKDILVIFSSNSSGTNISLTNLYVANLLFGEILNTNPRVTCARV